MSKKDSKELAEKIVDRYATYDELEVDGKAIEFDENELPTKFEKLPKKMIRFLEFGYTLSETADTKKDARKYVVDIIANDLESDNLVLSNEILESL